MIFTALLLFKICLFIRGSLVLLHEVVQHHFFFLRSMSLCLFPLFFYLVHCISFVFSSKKEKKNLSPSLILRTNIIAVIISFLLWFWLFLLFCMLYEFLISWYRHYLIWTHSIPFHIFIVPYKFWYVGTSYFLVPWFVFNFTFDLLYDSLLI